MNAKPIRKIALIGAGSVGSYIIHELANVAELEFTVIADGARKERLAKNGLFIKDNTFHPAVKSAEEAGEQDLIIIATKYSGLDDAIAMLPAMTGENTLVMSVLNGVDSEERIAKVIGMEHVVYSIIRIAARRADDGNGFTYRLGRSMGITYGIAASQTSELSQTAVERISEAFGMSTIYHHPSEKILLELWLKYASNVTNNLPQAIVGVPACFYDRGEHGYFIASRLWDEVHAVALSKGIELGEGPGIFPGDNTYAKYSTLQDIEGKRHTEIDMFAGVLISMAKEAGIAVPYAEYTYHLIKALEEKNDGLFNV